MALWELDEFQGAQFLGYVRGVPEDPAFRGQEWLPNQNIDDTVFDYIRGVRNRPVMAHVMGYDSEAPIAGRRGLGERVQGELPPIKRKARISEKELIRFVQPRAQSQDRQNAIDSVYDLADTLIFGIQARAEWLRLQALSEDTIVYDEGGVQFVFDFGIDEELQVDLTTGEDGTGANVAAQVGPAWSNVAASTPLATMQFLKDRMVAKWGTAPAEFTVSQQAWGYALRSDSLRTLIRGANAPTALLTRGELDTLFDIYELPRITTYDVKVERENEDGTRSEVRPLRVERGFFTPATPVGRTLWGPTAESRALIGTNLAQQAPGIMVVTYGKEEPPSEWVKAAAVAFPTMPDAHLVAQVELF